MKSWYVITGAPCSGKTTLLNSLVEKGYSVIPEVARTYIDESLNKGISVANLRADELEFQKEVLSRKYSIEKSLDKEKLLFFDRGIPDSHAYFKLLNVTDKKLLNQSLVSNYKKVFILDPCPYKEDYARTETEDDQMKIHTFLQQAYTEARATVVPVPIFSTKEERVDFVLNNL